MCDDTSDHANTAIELLTSGITDLAIPLPPVVKKSFWKAVCTLITGLGDVPAAWLESRAQDIRDEKDARSYVTKRIASLIPEDLASDPALLRRATVNLSSRLIREQKNREAVANAAVQELRLNPPKEDAAKEIDDDWLNILSRISEQKSSEEMQLYLAKVLAGEIRKPGSFSPATVQVLATLTPDLARTFQRFCNFTLACPVTDQFVPGLMSEPYGHPGQNSLEPIGFPFITLTLLQDAGLIKTEMDSSWTLPAGLFTLGITIGGQPLRVTGTHEGHDPTRKAAARVVLLTSVGCELRRIVHTTGNAEYTAKVCEWISKVFLIDIGPA